jgi:hypothetical protein
MAFKTFLQSGASDVMAPVMSPGGSVNQSGWTPSVLYMLLLVTAEILLVGWLSKHL